MLLMVMEMRMSDWTDFVGVISVCFKVHFAVMFTHNDHDCIWDTDYAIVFRNHISSQSLKTLFLTSHV